MTADPPWPPVVVAGATGFVGQALGPRLGRRFDVTGLSRVDRPAGQGYSRYRRCDLLSLEDTERALDGARYAVYLVHSMMPSASLTAGDFRDLDLLCADNFARAATRAGVEQIVYLGGLAPDTETVSRHLESRMEVERALASRGVPLTTLRAGLVLGAAGSSFQIMRRLVRRLPYMVTPRWTGTRTQPIALQDAVVYLDEVIGRSECLGRTFDIGAPDVVTYREMMRRTAELGGKRPRMAPVPLLTPRLSRLWLTLVTGAPKALAAPLIESLAHEMLVRERSIETVTGHRAMDVDAALAATLNETAGATPLAFRGARGRRHDGRALSVQRLRRPPGRDVGWVGREYLDWLHRVMRGAIKVDLDGERARFRLAVSGTRMLTLALPEQAAGTDRFVLRIEGGALARRPAGHLEFRQVLGDDTLLAVVHGFEPSLPWWIYVGTQALIHESVMAAFRRHLARMI